MSSLPLHPMSLAASLESHGNDTLLPSSPRRSSGQPSLSPADCCTLKKILRDVGNTSPLSTPNPAETGPQRFADDDFTGCTADDSSSEQDKGHHLVGDEADTGHEGENVSMELNEGVEGDHIKDVMNVATSQTVPSHQHRLQESAFTHEEMERLKYSRRHTSIAKHLEVEHLKQEQTTHEQGSGFFVPRLDAAHYMTTKAMDQSIHGASGADNEDDAIIVNAAVAQTIEGSQIIVAGSKAQTTPIDTSFRAKKSTMLLVPNTPIAAVQALNQDHIQFATDHNIPETPFTKILSHFKACEGAENSFFKRRRNTALPQDIALVVEAANSSEQLISSNKFKMLVSLSRHCPRADWSAANTTVDDLGNHRVALDADQQSSNSRLPEEAAEACQPIIEHELCSTDQVDATAVTEVVNDEYAGVPESAPGDIQKQLIILPQHPAFVNAIGMIPATMFWVATAPIVKYTNIAVDLLIDKLRETYL